jgi:hypothetical protein
VRCDTARRVFWEASRLFLLDAGLEALRPRATLVDDVLGVLPCLLSWEAACWREAEAGLPTAKATKMSG